MRKSFLLLAAGLLVGSWAQADEGARFKFNGEVRARYQNDNARSLVDTAKDGGAAWNQRNKLGVTMMSGENVTAHISLLHNHQWGADTANSTTSTGNLTPTDTNSLLSVYEAWGWWKASENFSLRLGRGSLEVGDGTVISVDDWNNPHVFEGLLASMNFDFATLNLFYVVADDVAITASPEVQNVFVGLSADLKNLPEVFKIANIHVLQVNTKNANNLTQTRYGLTLAGDSAGVDFRGTYHGYSGENGANDLTGSMFDLELGYTLADMMGLRIFGYYHMDSGDSNLTDTKTKTYSSFHYDTHKYAGVMDVITWGNLTNMAFGVSLMPTETLKTGLTYHSFKRSEQNDTSVNGGTGVLGNSTTAYTNTTDKEIGSEIDLWIEKMYEGGFSIYAHYGMFSPGAFLKNGGSNLKETYGQFLLQAKMVF